MKKSFLYSFLKFQFAAIVATIIDLSTFYVLIYFHPRWYLEATAFGALLGAITNFIICRYWVTTSVGSPLSKQAIKYALVSTGSLLLNTLLVYISTDTLQIEKEFSRIIAAVIVAISYNFLLQKYFVFKT